MADAGVGSVIVLEKNELVGIFTERDLLKICAKKHLELESIQLRQVMTKSLTVASADDSVDNVLATMVSKKFRHMPVMEGDKILGLISIGDAVKHKMQQAIEEAHILRQYIHG
jgi:CBS domain-containing protein